MGIRKNIEQGLNGSFLDQINSVKDQGGFPILGDKNGFPK